MNVKELIEKFEERKTIIGNFQGWAVWWEDIKEIFGQLDEPKPVKVPQYVADWYEENKDDFEFNVWDWIAFSNEPEKLENKEFNSWINNGEGNPIQTLVNMHQFGYEVEEEKRYRVKVKGVSGYGRYLNKALSSNEYFFASNNEIRSYRTKFTRKELEEAGFGWVFDCEGIEIEEVE